MRLGEVIANNIDHVQLKFNKMQHVIIKSILGVLNDKK